MYRSSFVFGGEDDRLGVRPVNDLLLDVGLVSGGRRPTVCPSCKLNSGETEGKMVDGMNRHTSLFDGPCELPCSMDRVSHHVVLRTDLIESKAGGELDCSAL